MAKKKRAPRPAVAGLVVHRVNPFALGRHHDLQAIFNFLNVWYFGGKIQAEIKWGRRSSKPIRIHKSIRMGGYVVVDALIYIHPALDRSWVPAFFVEYIVFHEMLHEHLPPRRKNRRNDFHYREFVEAERAFPGYGRAVRWERRNINRLLCH